MWLRKDELDGKLGKDKITDWVDIEGIIWVEIPDKKGVMNVQPSIKREVSKNSLPFEACMEEAND